MTTATFHPGVLTRSEGRSGLRTVRVVCRRGGRLAVYVHPDGELCDVCEHCARMVDNACVSTIADGVRTTSYVRLAERRTADDRDPCLSCGIVCREGDPMRALSVERTECPEPAEYSTILDHVAGGSEVLYFTPTGEPDHWRVTCPALDMAPMILSADGDAVTLVYASDGSPYAAGTLDRSVTSPTWSPYHWATHVLADPANVERVSA